MVAMGDIVVGQYTASADGTVPGYLNDPTVPPDSLCPTFCTTVLHIHNERWDGVPFILKAGKVKAYFFSLSKTLLTRL